MHDHTDNRQLLTGVSLAVLATLIWSGNFIIARGVYKEIPPVSLAFFRWTTAAIIIFPLAIKKFISEKELIFSNWRYLFWSALTGVTIFNTFVYIAGHYSTAINLALIGTTTSPVFSIILARIFLREAIFPLRILGLILCFAGILLLLSHGDYHKLATLSFSTGDLWMLAAGFFFAVYNILVRKKPSGLSAINFLFVTFAAGTLILFPFYLKEAYSAKPIEWNIKLYSVILYLGLGTSVISFFCWNGAIIRLGAATASLFGNLIPVFSTIEAILILNERFTWIHLASMIIIITGLVIANRRRTKG